MGVKVLRSKEGFTLIEWIAIIVIMGILAVVVVPRYLKNNKPHNNHIESVTVFKHDEYGFYIELYPEYKRSENFTRKDRLVAGKKEETITFKVRTIEEKGIYDMAVISFTEIDEIDKKKIKEFYGFGQRISRNAGVENMINKNTPQTKWEIYYYDREEENRHLDFYAFFPSQRNDLCIWVVFVYQKNDLDIMKKKIQKMIYTVKIINK
jgi:hypothetical protein